ncbi:urate oxidase [Halalkalibacterium halodurans]|uniref:Uricase n=1 Tax=Halalkalibacterium halodurans (strain ATCC BAA-125 / DSM 18197 / FERM 7344 / JCM 9153 / C-125) TaxID=272558 RepID=Q9KEU0_HALH5|nr:urate oxidase [Halalkalibacterium halodurans]MED4080385.1 urate oxidase [Halalkalibacterium halodurans]MED4084551.1 urate oxidase [Halalkalibacterium halodurans]MED4104885.1 urate oxidase [Halalkalibacterium halodurans]MED4109674.1 urate oxidase [Halalkalibacterium halodurans]MED4122910.1 urate oxidase [Halalkalibacterium halodurans]
MVSKDVVKQQKTEKRTMYYGKGDVFVYRTNASPLEGIKAIPESSFSGRKNVILGMDLKVALKGDAFLSSFTDGDNSLVIATDSMKNFILRKAAFFNGSTMEDFLQFISKEFLNTYSHISSVSLSGDQLLFHEVPIPSTSGFQTSDLLFQQEESVKPFAKVEVRRMDTEYKVMEQLSGIQGLRLIKVKESSFYGYIQDEYTTLPEAYDRPLFLYLNMFWAYENPEDATGIKPDRYVSAEQVAAIAYTVFHEMNCPSIQNLLYQIGLRVLMRFPQLVEISFESNNRTWETVVEEAKDERGGKVYTEPRPPYGFQGFSMTREDLLAAERAEK